jgi:hypothetical protein
MFKTVTRNGACNSWSRADGELSRFVGWLTFTHTQRWHAQPHNVGSGHLYQGRCKYRSARAAFELARAAAEAVAEAGAGRPNGGGAGGFAAQRSAWPAVRFGSLSAKTVQEFGLETTLRARGWSRKLQKKVPGTFSWPIELRSSRRPLAPVRSAR